MLKFTGPRPAWRSCRSGTSRGGWAIVASLVATARLTEVAPLACPSVVIERMVSSQIKVDGLVRLLPRPWRTERPAAVVHA